MKFCDDEKKQFMKSPPLKFLGLICLLTLIGAMLFQSRSAQFQPGTGQYGRDLAFATVGSQELRLDLYLPEAAENPPVVVYIHGGGWSQGSYKSCPICWLSQEGFAVASVSYRLSDVAKFPAQMHDVKAAVRWLRAQASNHDYDAKRIAVSGSSAGAYLALMLGLTDGDGDLEGTVGGMRIKARASMPSSIISAPRILCCGRRISPEKRNIDFHR